MSRQFFKNTCVVGIDNGDYRDVMFYSTVVMLKTVKFLDRVVWVFRKNQWVAQFSTDLDLSII